MSLRALRLPTILALAVVSLGTAQAADAMTASAQAVQIDGGLELESGLRGLVLKSIDGHLESVAIEADSAQMLRWTRDGVYVDCMVGRCPQQSAPTQDDPQMIPASGPAIDVQLSLQGADDWHQLSVVPIGATHLAYQGPRLHMASMPDACMSHEGFGPLGADCQSYDGRLPGFSDVPFDGPIQLINATRGHGAILKGDFVLEIVGVTLGGQDTTFDARQTQSGGVAGTYQAVFGRILLENATVRMQFSEGVHLQWAVQKAQVLAQDGVARLHEASGTIKFPGERSLKSDDMIAGDFMLRSSATEGGIAFGIEQRAQDGSPLAASVADMEVGWPLALLVSVFPAIGIALATRRHQAHTSMRDVEQALRRGRYGRADRLSRRILRHDPFHESAQLSRAIALTRSGRPQAAVADVQRFLARHQASDGTLHYVLGMALLDLDRPDEARSALAAAVERTPSLLTEISPQMRPAQDGAYT